jgi:hypothetical protein
MPRAAQDLQRDRLRQPSGGMVLGSGKNGSTS